MHAANEEFQC